MANIAANIIIPNYSRTDFVQNIYLNDLTTTSVLRELPSVGCKARIITNATEAKLAPYDGCAAPTNLDAAFDSEILDLVATYINKKFCLDTYCLRNDIPKNELIAQQVIAIAAGLSYDLAKQRYFGDKASGDLMDGYVTLAADPTSGVITVTGASQAAITNPATVIAEMTKIYVAAPAIAKAHRGFKFAVSPAVYQALMLQAAVNPLQASTIMINGVMTFMGKPVVEITELSLDQSNPNAGIVFAGVLGDYAEASMLWYSDANDRSIKSDLEIREMVDLDNTYKVRLEMNVLPYLVNTQNLVFYA